MNIVTFHVNILRVIIIMNSSVSHGALHIWAANSLSPDCPYVPGSLAELDYELEGKSLVT